MDLHQLGVLFNCFIVGGFVVPVVNVAVGALGGLLHLGGVDTDLDVDADLDADFDLDADLDVDADLDADFDLDADLDVDADFDLAPDAVPQGAQGMGHGHGPIPVNLMTLSLTAVVFGAVGRLCLGLGVPILPGLLVSAFCGVLAGALLGRFVIAPLKHNRSYATNVRRLRGAEAVVRLEIRGDFEGKIALPGATGSIITYGARPAPGIGTIPVGQTVIIVGVDAEKEVCVVQPLCDTLEETKKE